VLWTSKAPSIPSISHVVASKDQAGEAR
jgi:hypothetical protein